MRTAVFLAAALVVGVLGGAAYLSGFRPEALRSPSAPPAPPLPREAEVPPEPPRTGPPPAPEPPPTAPEPRTETAPAPEPPPLPPSPVGDVRLRVVAEDPEALWAFTRTGCTYEPGRTPAVVVEMKAGNKTAWFNASCLAVVEPGQLPNCLCVRHAYFPRGEPLACVEIRGEAIDSILERFRVFATTLESVVDWPGDAAAEITLVGLCLPTLDWDRLRATTPGALMAEQVEEDGTTVIEIPLPGREENATVRALALP